MANPRGNPQNLRRGGKRGHKGAGGRPPDEFKRKCAEYLDLYDLAGYMADVARGEKVEEVPNPNWRPGLTVQKEPKTIFMAAATRDRQKAIEWLADRAYGKAPQALEHSGPDGSDIPYSIEIKTVTAIEK